MKAIVTYHSIDGSNSVISVDRDTIRRHVDWLLEANVPVRPLSEVVKPECTKGVALTFDDGFENFATEAWPILRANSLPATVFVVSDWVGRDNGWDSGDPAIPRLPLMDWSTLAEMAGDGIELGGHTCGHRDLTTLGGEELRSEIEKCGERMCAELDVRPTSFAYPYGRYDADAVAAVRAAGYDRAVTTEMALLGCTPHTPFELPRLDAFYLREPGVLERWGTERFRRFVRLRAGARRLRRVLARTGLVS